MPTTNTSPDNHISDLIPGYALDCLNPDELLQVSEHLPLCSQCQAELESYRQVVDGLYLAAPQATPPPDLKKRLLNEVQQPGASPGVDGPASIWERLRSGLPSLAPAWAFVGLAIVVILAASNLWLWQRLNRLEASTATDFRVVALAGTEKAPAAAGILVMNREGDQGTLVVDGLPQLDAAHQYQLWLIQDGQRASGGVFSVSREGYGSLVVNSEQPLYRFPSFGITVEPAGGSPGPTGDKVMGGNLPGSR